MRRTLTFLLIAIWVFALCRYSDIFFNPDTFLPRDNRDIHHTLFEYVTNHLKFFHSIPTWNY